MVTSRDMRPGIYVGAVHHRRTLPVAHAFRFPLFMVLLDIDRIPEMMAESWCTGYNRPAWASFYERDHFGPADHRPLRERLRAEAARQGLQLPDGQIFLLTHLRYLGYCFNPVSFYYCHDAGGALQLTVAEVRNTFGGTHNYWLHPRPLGARTSPGQSPGGSPLTGAPNGADVAVGESAEHRAGRGAVHASARKSFYVSPFMTPDLDYSFVFSVPGDRLAVHISASHTSTRAHIFDASLRMAYRPWTSAEITRTLFAYPAMTMSVIAGIHWQAVRLWWKGLRVVRRPTPDGVFPAVATQAVHQRAE